MTHRRLALSALLACVALLGACGGSPTPSSAGTTDPLDGVPASASASSEGFVSYLMALISKSPDDREPVTLDGVTPPTSDAAEPTSL